MKLHLQVARPFFWLRGALQFLGPLLNAFLILALCHGFFHWVFPRLASRFLGRNPELFETVPNFLGLLYVVVILLVTAAFVMANQERRRAFMRPLLSLLTGDPTHPAGLPLFRYVVLGGLPFVLALSFSMEKSPEFQPVLKVKNLPKGPLDKDWSSVPARRHVLFSTSSRLVSVNEAYLRVARKGERVAVQVQFSLPEDDRLAPNSLCELWWLDHAAEEAMPGVLGGVQEVLNQPLEGWQGVIAPISSDTRCQVLSKGLKLSPKYSEPQVQWALEGEHVTLQYEGTMIPLELSGRYLALRLQTGSEKVLLRSAWSKCSWEGFKEDAKSPWWLVFVFFLIELVFMTLASSGGTEI